MLRSNFWKYEVLTKAPYTLFQPLAFSEGVSKNSENSTETNKFDMGFKKNNMRSRFETIDFFVIGEFLRQLHLNRIKLKSP
jgi:hypothetical protein